jgi:hypothetical protein
MCLHAEVRFGTQAWQYKVVFSRLLKKGQMQGPRNPEE